MVYSVAQARRHLEDKFEAVAETTLTTFEEFLDSKKKELVAELDKVVALQAEVPGFDLSQYATVEKFELSNAGAGNQAVSLSVGGRAAVNVILRANKVYDCFFLMRERASPKAEAKTG